MSGPRRPGKLPSRLRRLDDALADPAIEAQSMLLSELDGFLTGLVLDPDPILPDMWLPYVWGGGVPFDDPLDTQWLVGMVLAHQKEIARDLGRGKPQPIFDTDERTGDVLWEVWIEGFDLALELRPEAWDAAPDSGDVADAIAYLAMLGDIAADESALTSIEINAISDAAPVRIADALKSLHAWRAQQPGAVPVVGDGAVRAGRNDPCPCGSGKKHKRCCGAT